MNPGHYLNVKMVVIAILEVNVCTFDRILFIFMHLADAFIQNSKSRATQHVFSLNDVTDE